MSHWVGGKIQLKCSLEVLKKALLRLMPEWQSHIQVDPEGRIPIYTYQGVKAESGGYQIVVPGIKNPNYAKAPGMKYSDLGIRKNSDGTWEVQVDRSGLEKYQNIENGLCAEVAMMKAQAIAKLRGHNILSSSADENIIVTKIEASSDSVRQLMA